MKKALFILITLFFAAPQVFSQVHFGVRGGIINSTVNYSQTSAGQIVDNRNGLIGSALIEFRINDGFAIQPEIAWAQRGWDNTSVVSIPFITTIETKQAERINYAEIPLMMKAGFGIGPVRLDLLAGPSFSLALNGKRTTTVKTTNLITNTTSESPSDTEDLVFDQDYKKADLNLQGGAALSFRLGGTRIFVDGRYLYGVTDLSNSSDTEITSRGVAITGGLLFGF